MNQYEKRRHESRRRHIVLAIGAGALTAPFASLAQQPVAPAGPPGKIWRVGILGFPQRPASLESHYAYGGIPQGMRDHGYSEGKNLAIEWRFAENDARRLPALAAELVQWKPDVLVAGGDQAALALKNATATIPIVTAAIGDPLSIGLIKSLARPGGNITGVTNVAGDLGPKQLELLLAMVAGANPRVTRVAVLINPAAAPHYERLQSLEAAAKTLGIRIVPVEAHTPAQLDTAFAAMRQKGAGALFVLVHPFFQQHSQQIAELAAKSRLPTMTGASIYPEAGCLMSYGTNFYEHFRRATYYVDRIFKGAKPADLPFEQPTRFELVINARTARALGLTIPQALLISAGKVIE